MNFTGSNGFCGWYRKLLVPDAARAGVRALVSQTASLTALVSQTASLTALVSQTASLRGPWRLTS